MRTTTCIIACLLCTVTLLHAQENTSQLGNMSPPEARVLQNESYRQLDGNLLWLWLGNNGSSAHNPHTDRAGLFWKAGSTPIVYQDGLLWGGYVDNRLAVGGATYRYGLQAGPILPDGTAADPSDPLHRVFRLLRVDRATYALLDTATQRQLRTDFDDWPAEHGAPFVDADSDGVYSPDFDAWLDDASSVDHPLFPGEQVLWFVSNDLDAARTTRLYGSDPVGLELQVFAWSGTANTLLQNTIFIEYTLVNHNPAPYKKLRLARWSDPDLGSPIDDCVGVDSALALQYVYNGRKEDTLFTDPPPAFGYVWLQTPVEPGGVTAGFGLGSLQGYRNVPIDAFTYYRSGDPLYTDPELGTPAGTWQMWQNMIGRVLDEAIVDPTTGEETRYALQGDPVLGTGWYDGVLRRPGDRRMLGSTARTDLAVGGTQKAVLALTLAEGGNHLLSVRALRGNARRLHDYYRIRRLTGELPTFSHSITYPYASLWKIRVRGGPFLSGHVHAVLRDSAGTEIASASMHDDGLHGDGAAGDGIFGGELNGSHMAKNATLFVDSFDAGGNGNWFVADDVPIAGDMHVAVDAVVSDHLNYDGKINPGENVRLQLRFENSSLAAVDRWHVFPQNESVALCEQNALRCALPVAPDANAATTYDPADANSYLAVSIPQDQPPGVMRLPVALFGEIVGFKRDTLLLEVEEMTADPGTGQLEHVAGNASGTLDYRIAQQWAVKPHRYRIDVISEDHEDALLRVTDETAGVQVADSIPFPDDIGHSFPLIDGWKLLKGSAFAQILYDAQGRPVDIPLPEAHWSAPERAWFTPYDGNLLDGYSFFGSALRAYDLHPVRLVFDSTQGQKAYTWLRGGNPSYGFTGYNEIPVRAYDISDTAAPRQITLGFVEDSRSPLQNGTWDPGTPGDREYLFIFADDYHETPQSAYQDQLLTRAPELPIYYALWPMRDTSKTMFEDGDMYTIIPRIPVSHRDAYILDLTMMSVPDGSVAASQYTLYAAYPQPLGAATGRRAVIAFDTPEAGELRLELYDLLGRKVRTLANGRFDAGRHHVGLDGDNLHAGTYFYMLTTRQTRLVRRLVILR